MECKYVQDKLIALHHLELIDTLWNVNIAKFVMIVTPVAELIDTLWNVNVISGVGAAFSTLELIDTLWNVNEHFRGNIGRNDYRINRYIMECK